MTETQKNNLTDEEFEEAVKMLRNYCSTSSIAKKFGISHNIMRRIFNSRGYNTRIAKKYWHKDKVDKLKQLFFEGKDMEEVAKEMDKSVASIKQKCTALFGTQSVRLIRQVIREERRGY